MDQALPDKKTVKPRILVAPLDWGLGHATRCIPIIRDLLNQGAEVVIAGEGAQQALLKQEFPGQQFLELSGYRVKYGRSGLELLKNLLYQAPGILRRIKEEQQWLKETVITEKIDGIISDNRYGLFHESKPSIFITHQLLIKTPWGKWTDQLLQRKNYSLIEKFNAIWIPDVPGPGGLAGELSHPQRRPRIPVTYIGPLSRFRYSETKKIERQVLVLISGPEPQRSLFEKLIKDELEKTPLSMVVVRGLPGYTEKLTDNQYVTWYNHLPALAMQAEIANAEYVITRSGYSTVMDLARMRKKAILVPTPGQTEQEYLADHLMKKKLAYSIPQNKFSLKGAVEKASKLKYTLEEPLVGDELKIAVKRFLELVLKTATARG